MSHFYAVIQGNRGEATRMGSKLSGLRSNTAGWGGCISVYVYERDGQDHYNVSLVPWSGSGGESRVIAEGPLDANAPEFITRGAALGSRDLKTSLAAVVALLRKMVNDWPQAFEDEHISCGDDAVDALFAYVREAKEILK